MPAAALTWENLESWLVDGILWEPSQRESLVSERLRTRSYFAYVTEPLVAWPKFEKSYETHSTVTAKASAPNDVQKAIPTIMK